MLALIRPDQGQVNLVAADGSIYSDTSATRVNFMYVPQGNTLLSGTVRENVLLGAPECSDADVEQVLRTACADFVFDLPEGIHTRVVNTATACPKDRHNVSPSPAPYSVRAISGCSTRPLPPSTATPLQS